MNITTYKHIIKLALSTIALVAGIGITQSVFANENLTACKAHIQGKIAWDPSTNFESGSKWDDKNLDYLCGNTTSPKAPGECFHHVMTSHVSYGDSDKWEYQNAIELCSGSNDADATVNCFKGKIKDKVDWKAAISQCQAKKTLENVAE
jgi:hypothetical protein